MQLIGSTTSPYVRRIRLLLDDQPYEFINLNIYGEGRDELRRTNPTLKIPVSTPARMQCSTTCSGNAS